eukprot:3933417-Pyramimonas_sp.AAC.1
MTFRGKHFVDDVKAVFFSRSKQSAAGSAIHKFAPVCPGSAGGRRGGGGAGRAGRGRRPESSPLDAELIAARTRAETTAILDKSNLDPRTLTSVLGALGRARRMQ